MHRTHEEKAARTNTGAVSHILAGRGLAKVKVSGGYAERRRRGGRE